MPQTNDVAQRLNEQRDNGLVTYAWQPSLHGTDTWRADNVMISCNFRPLGSAWSRIDRDAAVEIAIRLMCIDMAYGMPLMSWTHARDLIAPLFRDLDNSAVFFTNSVTVIKDDDAGRVVSWRGASDATFDAGIVCLTAEASWLLWVEDED